MKKCHLPWIRKTSKETKLPIKSVDFSSPFSTLLKQFKLKNQAIKMRSPQNYTKSNYLTTEAVPKQTAYVYDDDKKKRG